MAWTGTFFDQMWERSQGIVWLCVCETQLLKTNNVLFSQPIFTMSAQQKQLQGVTDDEYKTLLNSYDSDVSITNTRCQMLSVLSSKSLYWKIHLVSALAQHSSLRGIIIRQTFQLKNLLNWDAIAQNIWLFIDYWDSCHSIVLSVVYFVP